MQREERVYIGKGTKLNWDDLQKLRFRVPEALIHTEEDERKRMLKKKKHTHTQWLDGPFFPCREYRICP